jgi:hypothetical protein
MNLLDDGVALALGATALLAVTRTLKVQAYAGSVARYPSYPYYVVNMALGKVVSGWEHREDAEEAVAEQAVYPWGRGLQVLTAAGVRRKYGGVTWAQGPDETAHYRGA